MSAGVVVLNEDARVIMLMEQTRVRLYNRGSTALMLTSPPILI